MVEESVLQKISSLKCIEFLWPNIWLILENAACTLEENVSSAVVVMFCAVLGLVDL